MGLLCPIEPLITTDTEIPRADFTFRQPCLRPLLLATSIAQLSLTDYWNGPITRMIGRRNSYLRLFSIYDSARIAILMNRTAAAKFDNRTLA